MKITLCIIVSILLWSLYPLLSVWALEKIDPFSMMLVIQFAAFHGALIFALIALIKRNQISEYIQLQKQIGLDGIYALALAGACSAFSHIFFLFALTMANRNAIPLIIEIWPILALFYAPQFIEKKWQVSTATDYIIGVIAFLGIAVIFLSDERINWFRNEEWHFETVLAYVITIISCYMMAILNLLRAQYAQRLEPLKNSFASVMIAEAGTRLIGVFFILVAMAGMGMELQNPTPVLGISIIIGAGIFALAGAAMTYSIMQAKNPNISLFFYLIPITSIFWLVLAGESELTLPIVIGSIITIGACIYLTITKKKAQKIHVDAQPTL